MNRKEWKELCKLDRAKGYYWHNKVTKKRISKEFESLENCDVDAKVIHHLRDTEEQRKYNDEHYELFGFEIDEDGNEVFNYGKYVVFWTKEHHDEYHSGSEETHNRMSRSQILLWQDPVVREKRIASLSGHETSQETRKKISVANSGRKFTEEHREKLCIARRKRVISEDTKLKTSKSITIVMSNEEHRNRISETVKMQKRAKKSLYYEYRSFGGSLLWNDFQSFLKHNFEKNYVPTLNELKEALSSDEDNE